MILLSQENVLALILLHAVEVYMLKFALHFVTRVMIHTGKYEIEFFKSSFSLKGCEALKI